MNIPVLRRQVQTVLAIGLVLLSASAILELASVARTATERAATECSLVAGGVARQLGFLVEDEPHARRLRRPHRCHRSGPPRGTCNAV